MSEFHCLVMALFSPMFLCFLHDSFELQEMVCLTLVCLSSLEISRRTFTAGAMMNILAIRSFLTRGYAIAKKRVVGNLGYAT